MAGQWVIEDSPPTGKWVVEVAPVEKPRQGAIEWIKSANRNLGAGMLKGATDIGTTLLYPLDELGITGKTNKERKAAIDQYFKENADPESTSFKTGALTSQIAGTAGSGGLLGNAVGGLSKFAPTIAPMVANSLRSGGMTIGVPPAASILSSEAVRNAAIRVGGGAVSGGVMSGLVNPEDAGTGAVIGGAIPIAAKAGGVTGKFVKDYIYNPLFNPSISAVNAIVNNAGGVNEASTAIQRAISAGDTLSGYPYTLGQAGKNAGLSATERARSAVNPENYQKIYQSQRDARISAMQRIAGGADDLTRADSLSALKAKRENAVADLYSSMQDKPFMLGDEGEKLMARARPYGALSHAEKLAITQGRPFSIPVVDDAGVAMTLQDIDRVNSLRQTHPDYVPQSGIDIPQDTSAGLLAEIRKLGGVSMRDARDITGEKQITKMGVQGGVFTKKGQEVGDMVRHLVDSGTMPRQVLNDVDGGAQALRDEMQRVAGGIDDMSLKAGAETYYGIPDPLPGAYKEGIPAMPPTMPREIIDRVVKGGDLQSVKHGIDQAISGAEGPQKRVLMQLKDDYLKFMESKSPEYIRANNIFADKSKPITEMAVAQRMLDALTGEAAKHGGEARQASTQFLQAYRNVPLISRSVSGIKQQPDQVFTPENLGTVRQVAREISKHQDLLNLGRGVGSDTVQKAARANVLASVWDLVNSSKAGRATVNILSAGAKGRINNELDRLLQNPEYAGKKLSELTQSQVGKLKSIIENPVVRAGVVTSQSR